MMEDQERLTVMVVGGCNFDLVVRTDELPVSSETKLGEAYLALPGGKGVNQAVGIGRLGSKVRLLGKVGRDHFGQQVLEYLEDQGIDTAHVAVDEETPSGLALITLNRAGTRTIVVSPGANSRLGEADVERFFADVSDGAILVAGLEVPINAVTASLIVAKRRGMRTLLHASPVVPFSRDLLRLVDVLVLSQTELSTLSGRFAGHLQTAADAAATLLSEGVGTVITTMRERGALAIRRPGAWPSTAGDETKCYVPGFKVAVTSGNVASSAFVAGFSHCLSTGGKDPALVSAMRFGVAAMALSLSHYGCGPTLPTHAEVATFLSSGTMADARHAAQADPRIDKLTATANAIRRRIIRMLHEARSGHPGGSLSIVEVLTALYFHTMAVNPKDPKWPHRDRLVLSKGHAAPALYSALIEAGFLDAALEGELRKLGSPLQGHPDMKRCPGVDMSTGSLGQGLSVANGMAMAAVQRGDRYRVYCILGDGELQEGEVWEAAMTAAHRRLDNLVAIVDYNALQIDGNIANVKSPIGPIGDKWRAFGWHVINVDGHHLAEIIEALDQAKETKGKPTVLIAHTVKGRGISFMEGVIEYHGSTLSGDEVARALAELAEEA